ncbi:putative glutathione-dependent formaldehyde-activating enzyme [Rosellinia necatrix]|uniref:Putative glutathione-dependent formaldehyde-activating enzyme n=1 Tax=Rosellinia necatrix TaxID=77044 RepID=A0A1S7UIM0_ROSNE|nr:putative glutathione-dependent formaldehyde-activating enzyme [Rosellinia necatrix]
MASTTEFPKPKFITGGCLCGSLTYRIDFPENHDFEMSSSTCQCTQDRKSTGSFFFASHRVARRAFRWTSAGASGGGTTTTTTLGRYNATPAAERGFCTRCGSFLYWRRIATNLGGGGSGLGSDENENDGSGGAAKEEEEEEEEGGSISIAVGTVDPLFLFGEGAAADGAAAEGVPGGGFGVALANGAGGHEWCRNEIPGVTDRMAYLHERGRRWPGDSE